MNSKKKLQKARRSERDSGHASAISSAHQSYTSSKSSSASSFARAQSGDISLASSKSRSSLRVANPSPGEEHPYAIFNPRHSPGSSASSIISSDEPHTPPSAQEHFNPNASYVSSRSHEKGYMDDKRLHAVDDKHLVGRAHTPEGPTPADAPPAYSPLPSETETLADSGPASAADNKHAPTPAPAPAPRTVVTLTPDGTFYGPVQPSASHASSSSSASGRHAAGPSGTAHEMQRPPMQGNVSAPELHVPPPRDVPDRPTTVPLAAPAPAPAPTTASVADGNVNVAAPPVVKTRSRKPSVATPPRDLDSIDELDESDPLGLGWHNSGPYDAIAKAAKKAKEDTSKEDSPPRGAKIFVSGHISS